MNQKTYNKEYTAEEEPKRFEIFQQKLRDIENHNKKFDAGEVTYSIGINEFSDLTREEFRKKLVG